MTTASSRAALLSASKELTLMSVQIQDSNLYTQDYWRGYDRYGLTLTLPPDYLIDNPARWELIKD